MQDKNTAFFCLTAFSGLLFVVGQGHAQDAPSWAGTWKLDTAKSHCVGTPNAASNTAVVTEASGATHYVIDFTEADGTNTHLDFTAATDGKSVPVSGSPDYVDAVKMTEPKPGQRHFVFSKAAQRVEWDTFTMGTDGKQIHFRLAGIDQGKSWKCYGVSVRQ